VAEHHELKANQAEAASTVTTETKQPAGSDAPLEGGAALDLYLAELGSNVAAITQQSALLLQALAERAVLLRELQRTAAPATDDTPSKKPNGASSVAGGVMPPAWPRPSS
jgi:hypothetical protein